MIFNAHITENDYGFGFCTPSITISAIVGEKELSDEILTVKKKPFTLKITASDYTLETSELPIFSDDLPLSKDWALYIDRDNKVETSKENTVIVQYLGYDLIGISYDGDTQDDVEITPLCD